MNSIGCKKESGFTLVELSIVIVIIGLLMAGILSAYAVHLKKQQVDVTNKNIQEVNDAIAAFVQENGFFPCPASPNNLAARSEDCSDTVNIGGTSRVANIYTVPADPGPPSLPALPVSLRVGVVPVTTVDRNGVQRQLVPGQVAQDGWRNRLTYVVVEQMAIPEVDGATYNRVEEAVRDDGSARLIQLFGRDDPVNPLDGAARFLIISHGEDGVGAFSMAGQARPACGAGGTDDNNNCNGDAIFVTVGASGIRSTTGDANNFDDFVMGDVFRVTATTPTGGEQGSFMYASTQAPTCPDGWDEVAFNATTQRMPLENATSGVHTTTQDSRGVPDIVLPSASPPAWNTPSRTCKSQRGYRGQIEVSAHNMQDQSQNPCPSNMERIGTITRTALQQVQVASQCDDNRCSAAMDTVIQPVTETRVVCADPAD